MLLDGIAKSSGLKEIMSFYMHAECCLRLRLGDGRIFRIAWFQGVEGFVGWHPGACVCCLRRQCAEGSQGRV